MTPKLDSIWVYLATTPLLGLTTTLLAYIVAYRIYQGSGMNPLANPVAIAVILLVALLALTGTPYRTYFDGAQFVHFLLGPATVALAVPLYDHRARLRRLWLPLSLGLVAGVVTAIGSALGIAWALGATRNAAVAGAEIGHDPDCDGHRREDRRPAIAHRSGRHPDRHDRCNHRAARHPAAQVWLFDSKNLPAVGYWGFVHTNVHQGGANFTFLDGHARRFRKADYWNVETDRARTDNPELRWVP